MKSQKQILLSFFKSGKLQKLVTHEILKTLPKEDRQRFKEENPEGLQEIIDQEITKQLLAAGITLDEIDEIK